MHSDSLKLLDFLLVTDMLCYELTCIKVLVMRLSILFNMHIQRITHQESPEVGRDLTGQGNKVTKANFLLPTYHSDALSRKTRKKGIHFSETIDKSVC